MRAAILTGAVLTPLVVLWVARSEIVYHSADLAAQSLPVAAFVVLLALLPLCRGEARRRGALVVYAMLATTVGLASLGFAQSLVIQLPALAYRAGPENRWDELAALIPEWTGPRDPWVLRGFYLGGDLWRADILSAWRQPLALWTLMVLALTGAMLCLAWLLRRRFIEEQRLIFPLAVTAVEVCGLGSLVIWRNGLFWVGLGTTLAVQGLNAIHHLVPSVPALRVLPTDLGPLIKSAPWNAMGSLWVAFYPCATGLGYLLPSDTALSCWVWHLLTKGQYVLSARYGLTGVGLPLQGEQAQGAMLALGLLAVWPRRGGDWHGLAARKVDGVAVMLAGCLIFLTCFGQALGLSLGAATGFFGLYFLGMVAVTHLRAHVGPMWNPGTDVAWLLMAPFGARGFAPRELGALACLRWFSYGDCRGAPLPTQLEALKMAELTGVPAQSMAKALGTGLLVAVPSSLLAVLDTYYRYGADTANVDGWRTSRGDLPFRTLAGWLGSRRGPQVPGLGAVALGGVALWLHAVATSRLSWWPLRAAGYAMAVTGSLEWLWLPLCISWAIKSLVLRWGGMRAYRRSVPLFLGLVVGDYMLCGLLAALSCVLHRELYKPFPI